MLSKSLGKIGLGLVMSGILVSSLLAGCSNSLTAETKTVTVTSGGGTGSAMPNLVVYGDSVSNIGCLQTSLVHRGELLIFRSRVVDPKTGKDMTDKELKSVQIVLPDTTIKPFVAKYGKHGADPDSDTFWAVAWEVPLNYPTGSLGFEVKAEANDGRTGSWKPFGVLSSRLTVKEFDVAFVRNWTVNITATGFSVATVTATQGAKVTFSNKDTIPHKVVGDGWDSGDIAATKTFARVFDKAGTFVVKDAANPALTVTIVVNSPTS